MGERNWVGNSKAVFTTLGSSSHVEHEREKNDYYATDPATIHDLVKLIDIHKKVWEPACGEGHLAKELVTLGHEVTASDLVYRGYGVGGWNFLETDVTEEGLDKDIITNPPYKYAKQFVEKSLEVIKEGRHVAMFLKVLFLEGIARYDMFKNTPPKYVCVYSQRQVCAMNGDFETYGKGSATAYAWFIWEKGFKGDTIVRWIAPKNKVKKEISLEDLF